MKQFILFSSKQWVGVQKSSKTVTAHNTCQYSKVSKHGETLYFSFLVFFLLLVCFHFFQYGEHTKNKTEDENNGKSSTNTSQTEIYELKYNQTSMVW